VCRSHTESIAAAVPGAGLLVVPGTTHLVVREAPAVVAAAVGRLLLECGQKALSAQDVWCYSASNVKLGKSPEFP
jgi:hypothetical protein